MCESPAFCGLLIFRSLHFITHTILEIAARYRLKSRASNDPLKSLQSAKINRERGTCDNKKTISARIVEKGVFDGLRRRLMQPDKIKKFISEFHKEQQKIRQEQFGRRDEIKKRIAELDRKINRIIDAIEEGLLDAPMKARFLEYKEEKTILQEEEARLGEEPEVIEFHPNLDKIYQKKIDDLEALLDEDLISRIKAGTVLKNLISQITLYPGKGHGEMEIEIKGRLAEFLAFMSPERRGKQGDSGEYGVRMVVWPPSEPNFLTTVYKDYGQILISVLEVLYARNITKEWVARTTWPPLR